MSELNFMELAALHVKNLINPFPGLRPFGAEEAELFFGREEQVQALLNKLEHNRFVAVVGTSGSGKSSLVRAGLLPVLQEIDKNCFIAIMRPGESPVNNLNNALIQTGVFSDDETKNIDTELNTAILNSSELGLVQVLRKHITHGKKMLVLVDQFEEIFRFADKTKDSRKEANHFVQLLVEAISQRDVPVYVVISLRADFLGDCSQFYRLPEAINDGHFLVPRLTREQVRSTIIQPVNLVKSKIAPRLVQQLLNDVGDNPDHLPVLQHALMRTWEKWKETAQDGEPIDIVHYEAIGKMEKALNDHADEAYNELQSPELKNLAKSIFKTLTTKGNNNLGVRRPATLKQLCDITGAEKYVVLNALEPFRKKGREFIIPAHGELKDDSLLDISHESLMRVWEKLRAWVDEEWMDALLYKRLSESALLFKKGKSALWRDPELQEALEWKEAEKPNNFWAVQYNNEFDDAMKFLAASLRETENQRKEKSKRRLILNTVAVAALTILSVLTIWAFSERFSASKSAVEALKQKTIALEQGKLAEQKKLEAENNLTIAKTQRLQAEEQKQEAEKQRRLADVQTIESELQKKRAELASAKANDARKAAEIEKQIALLEKQRSDSLKVISDNSAQNVKRLRLLSIGQNLAIKSNQVRNNEDKDLKALLALQAYNFSMQNGGNYYDADNYNALYSAYQSLTEKNNISIKHNDAVKALACSNNGKYIASAGSDGAIFLYDKFGNDAQPQLLYRHQSIISSIAFNSNDKSIAAGTDDNLIILKNLDESKPSFLKGHTDKITSVVCNNNQVYSAALDFTIRVWNTENSAELNKIKLEARPLCMLLSSSKTELFAGCDDGIIYKINLKDNSVTTFIKTGQKVNAITLNNKGNLLAAGLSNGAIMLYDVSGNLKEKLNSHTASVTGLCFDENDKLLGSVSLDGDIKFWDISKPDNLPITIKDHNSWVWAIAFSPSSNQFITAGRDKTVRNYNLNIAGLADDLQNKIKRGFTQEEWNRYVGNDIPFGSLYSK